MRLKKSYLYFFIFISICGPCLSQHEPNLQADSLKTLIAKATSDTVKVKLLSDAIDIVDMDEIESYSKQLVALCDKVLSNRSFAAFKTTAIKSKAMALTGIGFIEDTRGNTTKAIEVYMQSLALQEQINDKNGIATNYNNLSEAYRALGDIAKALDYNKRSLKLWEVLKKEANAATAMHNLASIYRELNDDEKALDYYKRALAILEDTPHGYGVEVVLNSIGGVLNHQGKYKDALAYNLRSLKVAEKHNNYESEATALNSIGTIYQRFKQIDSAIYYFNKSLDVARKNEDKRSLFYTYNNLGGLYLNLAKFGLARSYADSSANVAETLGFPILIRYGELMLARVDSASGNYQSALAHFKRSILFRDSILNESNRKASIRNQLTYEFEKKEAVIKEQQEKERAVAEEKNRFQKIVIGSVLVGLLLVIVFAAFIFRSLKITRQQKIVIEEKQKEILDSIHYAKRIQKSLLPTEKYFEKNLRH